MADDVEPVQSDFVGQGEDIQGHVVESHAGIDGLALGGAESTQVGRDAAEVRVKRGHGVLEEHRRRQVPMYEHNDWLLDRTTGPERGI